MSAFDSYYNLEKTVERTGNQLDTVSDTLRNVERCLSVTQLTAQEGDQEMSADPESVMEVLESMSEVKNEYQNLKRELQEVQQLQREMSSLLGYQMRSMTQTYNILKKRIELRIPNQPPPPLPPTPVLSSLRSASDNALQMPQPQNHHHHHYGVTTGQNQRPTTLFPPSPSN